MHIFLFQLKAFNATEGKLNIKLLAPNFSAVI